MITPHQILEINNRKQKGHKVISYSQMSLFSTCPHKWKIKYIDKIKFDDPSIHMTFGTACHESIQTYVENIFSKPLDVANQVDFYEDIGNRLYKQYLIDLKRNNNVHYTNPKEMLEFTQDGALIMDWFRRHHNDYISKSKHTFLGTEIPIYYPIQENLFFMGFIDQGIGYKNSNEVLLWDYKTSTRGWNDYKKKDVFTKLQLVLYKYFLLKELGLDMRKYEKLIHVEYFILRRKLIDDSEFLQKRVQLFKPASGIATLNKAKKYLDAFVSKGFMPNSSDYNMNINHPATTGVSQRNCKFCKLKDNEELCPKHLRKTAVLK